MKQILSVFAFVVLFFSCNDDDSSSNTSPYSVAIGNKIYTIEEGYDQQGFLGQYLQDDIKISVTDFEGKPQYADLSFELSDEGGYVSSVYDYEIEDEEDWLVFRWKLGCTDDEQTLTIKDNVCNISKDGCVDVVIFEITVDVDDEPVDGWVEVCFEFGSTVKNMFSHEDEFIVYTYYNMLVSTDITSNVWEAVSTPRLLDEYDDVQHFENGDMLYEEGSYYYVSTNKGRSWSNVNVPISYGDGWITILANGDYLFVSEYSNTVYKSTDRGNNWTDVIADIASLTGDYYTEPVAIASSGNTAYVVTNNHYVIQIVGDNTTLHAFNDNAWSYYSELDNTYAVVQDGYIVLLINDYYAYQTRVLDLSTNSISSAIDLPSAMNLITDNDQVYLMPVSNRDYYYEYANGSFKYQSLDLPESTNSYNYGYLTMFKGQLIYFNSSSQKLYYYND